MADYSGYTPQRQQQRQDPWADAATGIAKMFMPDQETQLRMGQLRQQSQLNDIRLVNAEADRKATDARAAYDADRIAEAKNQRALLEEKGRIMADAAATKSLTPAQARRLAEINTRLGGAAGSGSVADIWAMTPDGKAAAEAEARRKAAEGQAKIDAEASAAAAKAAADRDAATETFYSAKAKEAKEYKPPSDADMANAFRTVYRSMSGGRQLSDGAVGELVTAAQRGQFTGTPAQVADKIMKIAFAGSHRDHIAPRYDAATVEAKRKTDPVLAAQLASEDDFKPDVTSANPGARQNLQKVQLQYPGTYYLEGTMDEIRSQALAYPPGTRIVYLDVNTGRHGGGITPSDESVYQQQSEAPDGNYRFNPWFNAGIAPLGR